MLLSEVRRRASEILESNDCFVTGDDELPCDKCGRAGECDVYDVSAPNGAGGREYIGLYCYEDALEAIENYIIGPDSSSVIVDTDDDYGSREPLTTATRAFVDEILALQDKAIGLYGADSSVYQALRQAENAVYRFVAGESGAPVPASAAAGLEAREPSITDVYDYSTNFDLARRYNGVPVYRKVSGKLMTNEPPIRVFANEDLACAYVIARNELNASDRAALEAGPVSAAR